MRYVERESYSLIYDANVVRIASAREGREYFAEILAEPRKTLRDRRDVALDAIQQAIESGREPGEVNVQ